MLRKKTDTSKANTLEIKDTIINDLTTLLKLYNSSEQKELKTLEASCYEALSNITPGNLKYNEAINVATALAHKYLDINFIQNPPNFTNCIRLTDKYIEHFETILKSQEIKNIEEKQALTLSLAHFIMRRSDQISHPIPPQEINNVYNMRLKAILLVEPKNDMRSLFLARSYSMLAEACTDTLIGCIEAKSHLDTAIKILDQAKISIELKTEVETLKNHLNYLMASFLYHEASTFLKETPEILNCLDKAIKTIKANQRSDNTYDFKDCILILKLHQFYLEKSPTIANDFIKILKSIKMRSDSVNLNLIHQLKAEYLNSYLYLGTFYASMRKFEKSIEYYDKVEERAKSYLTTGGFKPNNLPRMIKDELGSFYNDEQYNYLYFLGHALRKKYEALRNSSSEDIFSLCFLKKMEKLLNSALEYLAPIPSGKYDEEKERCHAAYQNIQILISQCKQNLPGYSAMKKMLKKQLASNSDPSIMSNLEHESKIEPKNKTNIQQDAALTKSKKKRLKQKMAKQTNKNTQRSNYNVNSNESLDIEAMKKQSEKNSLIEKGVILIQKLNQLSGQTTSDDSVADSKALETHELTNQVKNIKQKSDYSVADLKQLDIQELTIKIKEIQQKIDDKISHDLKRVEKRKTRTQTPSLAATIESNQAVKHKQESPKISTEKNKSEVVTVKPIKLSKAERTKQFFAEKTRLAKIEDEKQRKIEEKLIQSTAQKDIEKANQNLQKAQGQLNQLFSASSSPLDGYSLFSTAHDSDAIHSGQTIASPANLSLDFLTIDENDENSQVVESIATRAKKPEKVKIHIDQFNAGMNGKR